MRYNGRKKYWDTTSGTDTKYEQLSSKEIKDLIKKFEEYKEKFEQKLKRKWYIWLIIMK